jgi:hypothetical protein
VSVELKIRWEGTAPGLAEGRLSLGTFGEPLTLLLAGLRRIASNILSEAFENRPPGGRLANGARRLDIEINELITGSSGLVGTITVNTPPGETLPLIDLAVDASTQLLSALESESRGIPKSASVRRYLRSLPDGIAQQNYWLHKNGSELKHIAFGKTLLADAPIELPYLAEYYGNTIGVGFEPGRLEVRIKSEDSGLVTFTATSEQVESALNLRDKRVRAVAVVVANSYRLIILQEADRPLNQSTREEAVYQRWRGALKRLAQ